MLHLLPLPALDLVVVHIGSPDMGLFLKLAQLNTALREYFLSDWAWTRFDVHNASASQDAYTYGSYKLGGVAGHYLNFLAALEPDHRAWHLTGGHKVGKPEWNSLYDDLHKLCTLHMRTNEELSSQCPAVPKRAGVENNPQFDHDFKWNWGINEHRRRDAEVALVPHAVWTLYFRYSHPVRWDLWYMDHYEPHLRDRTLCLGILQRAGHGIVAHCLPFECYEDDWAINMALVNWRQYKLCSNRLQNNKQFLKAMISNCMWHFGYFDLFRDHSFFAELLAEHPAMLKFLADHYDTFFVKRLPGYRISDRKWMGWNELRDFPSVLRDDARFVIAAVSQSWRGNWLEFASKRLQDNEHVVVAAIKQSPDGSCLRYASERLRDDKDLILWAIGECPKALEYASQRLRDDPEIQAHKKKCSEKWTPITPRLQLHHHPLCDVWAEFLDLSITKLPYKRVDFCT